MIHSVGDVIDWFFFYSNDLSVCVYGNRVLCWKWYHHLEYKLCNFTTQQHAYAHTQLNQRSYKHQTQYIHPNIHNTTYMIIYESNSMLHYVPTQLIGFYVKNSNYFSAFES